MAGPLGPAAELGTRCALILSTSFDTCLWRYKGASSPEKCSDVCTPHAAVCELHTKQWPCATPFFECTSFPMCVRRLCFFQSPLLTQSRVSLVSSKLQAATATERAAVCLMCHGPPGLQLPAVLVAGGLGLRKALSPQATRNLIRSGSKRAEALEVLTAQVAELQNTLQVRPNPLLHVSPAVCHS